MFRRSVTWEDEEKNKEDPADVLIPYRSRSCAACRVSGAYKYRQKYGGDDNEWENKDTDKIIPVAALHNAVDAEHP